MAIAVLARANINALACADLRELIEEMSLGAGALVLAEEVAIGPAFVALKEMLVHQPPWSDVPVIVLARPGANSEAIASMMEEFANVTVIERPMRVSALVSSARSALRARRRQYELRALVESLHEADQRKTEFLATLAHELRNPLAPLSTALTLLARNKPVSPADANRYYELMHRQVGHMVRLVNDLMEVSRITRNKIDMELAALPLQKVIDDAIEQSRPQMEAAGHALVVEASKLPLTVRGDGVRLTQVFSNLLNNAAKYSPAGEPVKVVARREGHEAVVEVIDRGIGLAPDMLEAVFEMFVQIGGASKMAQGGLGIGLTLVKSLVKLHGGSVEAASAGLNQGSTFTVRLPLVHDDEAGASASGPAHGSSIPAERSVLVVDDNRDAADSLAELLRAMGTTALVAYSGEEALRLVESCHIDVAVLDIGMPGMDGCELARHLLLRKDGEQLTLIALTGWGQKADRELAAAAGFHHHLLKPVDATELIALL